MAVDVLSVRQRVAQERRIERSSVGEPLEPPVRPRVRESEAPRLLAAPGVPASEPLLAALAAPQLDRTASVWANPFATWQHISARSLAFAERTGLPILRAPMPEFRETAEFMIASLQRHRSGMKDEKQRDYATLIDQKLRASIASGLPYREVVMLYHHFNKALGMALHTGERYFATELLHQYLVQDDPAILHYAADRILSRFPNAVLFPTHASLPPEHFVTLEGAPILPIGIVERKIRNYLPEDFSNHDGVHAVTRLDRLTAMAGTRWKPYFRASNDASRALLRRIAKNPNRAERNAQYFVLFYAVHEAPRLDLFTLGKEIAADLAFINQGAPRGDFMPSVSSTMLDNIVSLYNAEATDDVDIGAGDAKTIFKHAFEQLHDMMQPPVELRQNRQMSGNLTSPRR